MSEKDKLSKQELIDKINLKVKVGYITLVMFVILYIANNVLIVVSSKYQGLGEFLILILLVTILGYILDGYKLIKDVLKLTSNKENG